MFLYMWHAGDAVWIQEEEMAHTGLQGPVEVGVGLDNNDD